MNPVMFVFHLPSALQSSKMPDNTKVEDFFCMYSGKLLIIGSVNPLEGYPWGISDVRDRIIELIKTAIPDAVVVPPCLTFGGALYTRRIDSLESIAKFSFSVREVKEQEKSIYELFDDFYLDNYLELENYYSASRKAAEINNIVYTIKQYESELLLSLKKFVTSTWIHPIERWRTANELKVSSANLLESLSKYSSTTSELTDAKKKVKQDRANDELFNELLNCTNMDSAIEPDFVNVDSAMNVIEHAREENNAFGSSSATTISAIAGAVIGSILTIAFSYLLGFIQ
jgi:hypothetical protein